MVVENFKRELNKSMDNENKNQESRKTPKRTKKIVCNANTASKASKTLPVKSTSPPLSPVTSANDYILKTSTSLHIKIPVKALKLASSPTTPTKDHNSQGINIITNYNSS
jgi:hypothetical protein